MKLRESWTYFGILVTPASRNSSGMRWHAFGPNGRLLADTKDGMRKLIRMSHGLHTGKGKK